MDNTAIQFLEKLPLENKIFIDVGANDGITGSMSYSLEKDGWTGILIEPNPVLANHLKATRKSIVANFAISNTEIPLEFNLVSGPANLHGLSRFDYSPEFGEMVKKHSGSIEKCLVNCKKLSSVLDTNHIPKNFSFLKVDVEGHELEVFKSLNLELYQPLLIIAEDNTKDLNKSVRKFLKLYNYSVVARIGTNNFYVQGSNISKFIPSFLSAQLKFTRWDLKRIVWKFFGKEFKSNNI
jgi:FkbM family methyltransferase